MPSKNLGRVSIVPKGTWNANTVYNRLDAVVYDGSSWLAKKQNIGQQPVDGSEIWQLLAERGADGRQGVDGKPGKGLTIIGHYDTVESMESSVSTPEPGDAYSVGTVEPYDIYTYDGVSLSWFNNGPLQGMEGPQGPKGDRGDIGPQGPKGDNGADGSDATVTADNIKTALGYAPGMTNPNLIDNPWFRVNQRGETVYTTTGYTVDRWKLNTKTNANASVTVESDGVQLYATGGTWIDFRQPIEFPERLNGKTVTLSIDANAEYIKSIELKNLTTNKTILSINVGSTNGRKIISKSCNIQSDEISADDIVCVMVFMTGSSAYEVCSAMVYAIKLEQGSVSTLAYDIPPDYGEQLVRCQRYYQRFTIPNINKSIGFAVARSSTLAAVMFNLLQPMRTLPTMSCTATFKLLGDVTKTAITPAKENAFTNMVRLNFTTSGLTANALYFAASDSVGYMEFSADL